jgi:glucokinase
MIHHLGVDVGGTNVRAAVANGDGTLVGRADRSTPAGGSAVTDAMLDAVDDACGAAGIDPGDVAAAGIGSMGPLDRAAGTVVDPPNVDGGGPIPLVGPLRERLGTDAVTLHNDATCGAVAEREAAGGIENLVYLTLSTGVGVGAVVDGDALVGEGGNAAEMGHVTVDPRGRMACGCGGDGHWEAYCGGRNVPRYAARLRRESDDSVETDLPADPAAFSAADVFDRAGDDDLAALVVERCGRWNAIGVAATVQAFAPARVVVGGAVALHNPGPVLDPIREAVPGRLSVDPPTIRLATLGADAVLRGALLIAERSIRE